MEIVAFLVWFGQTRMYTKYDFHDTTQAHVSKTVTLNRMLLLIGKNGLAALGSKQPRFDFPLHNVPHEGSQGCKTGHKIFQKPNFQQLAN